VGGLADVLQTMLPQPFIERSPQIAFPVSYITLQQKSRPVTSVGFSSGRLTS
jgi:hypothetical protein